MKHQGVNDLMHWNKKLIYSNEQTKSKIFLCLPAPPQIFYQNALRGLPVHQLAGRDKQVRPKQTYWRLWLAIIIEWSEAHGVRTFSNKD